MYGNNNNEKCPASKEERKNNLVLQTSRRSLFQSCKGRIPPCLLPSPCGSLLMEAPRAAGTPCNPKDAVPALSQNRGEEAGCSELPIRPRATRGRQGTGNVGLPPPRRTVAKSGADTKAASLQRVGCWHPFVLAQGGKVRSCTPMEFYLH